MVGTSPRQSTLVRLLPIKTGTSGKCAEHITGRDNAGESAMTRYAKDRASTRGTAGEQPLPTQRADGDELVCLQVRRPVYHPHPYLLLLPVDMFDPP